MKLVSARIQMYKSIEDSEEFSIDQVTCLVGKNESGKTAVLQALQKLNPVKGEDRNFHKTEYPQRFLSTYSDNTNVLTTEWELEQDDETYIEEKIGFNPIKGKEIVVLKGYDNVLWWKCTLDEEKIIQSLLVEAGISEDTRTKLQDIGTIEEFEKGIDEGTIKNEFIDDTIINIDKEMAAEATAFRNLKIFKKGKFPSGIRQFIEWHLLSRLPKMLYFTEYDKLPGKISRKELIQNRDQNTLTKANRIFLALLGLANSNIDQIQNITHLDQLIMELTNISKILTDDILKYWSQNEDLEVIISSEPAQSEDLPPLNVGEVFCTRINDRRNRATVNFDEKSTGFIWFFSFLIWFSQVRKNYGNNIIVLLDEPGLTLHGTAQKDLLRYITKELAVQHQIMYTTHSPFMINTEKIDSIRTVEDIENRDQHEEDIGNGRQRENESVRGTKVGAKILSRDKDTLLPLQGIVGFDIAQSMFVGPFILVVEGPSEAGYINWFSRALVVKRGTSLDIRWAVCPAEGASKIGSFVTLFRGRGLRIAALMDFHQGQKTMVNKLGASGALDEGCLLKTTDFINQEEADIEDLVGWSMMRYLIHKEIEFSPANELPENKPEGENKEIRIVKIIDEYMKKLPAHFPKYNHYTPVKSLQKININTVDSIAGLDEALDRFAELFLRLNKLINKEDE